MAIKAGDLLLTAEGGVLIERVQTGGPATVNITTETIYELGNYRSVGQVRDTPDLSFSLDSLDMSCALERLVCGGVEDQKVFDLAANTPIDVGGQWKPGRSAHEAFQIVNGCGVPTLALESVSYKFDVANNSTLSATLKGDSIYYTRGPVAIEEFAGTNLANQTCALAHDGYLYEGDLVTGERLALNVSVDGLRLVYGVDWTEVISAPTTPGTGRHSSVVTILSPVATTSKIRIMYSATPGDGVDSTAEPFTYPQSVHTLATVLPAAVKGRDVVVLIGGTEITNKFTSVQTLSIDWKVTLEVDKELGNYNNVAQDFDVPTVSGSVVVKPRNTNDLMAKLKVISGAATDTEVIGALQSVPLPLVALVHNPNDGSIIKAIYIPDARFVLPGFSQKVQAKYDITMNFSSDTGAMLVYDGDPTPELDSLDVSTGGIAGGTAVTLTGVKLSNASAVKFGTASATSVVVVDDNTVTCVSPAHSAGTVDVTVVTPFGTSGPQTFTYS